MRTAACYIRVSTDDQLEYSPDSQLEKIRDFAGRNNMLLPDDNIFIEEEGVSGRKAEKRHEFQKMIAAAKSKPKPFDVILVWKFSRFARNREDSIVYKSVLRKQLGIDVISVSENIGDDKMSVITEAIIEAMDEYYSVNLGEEVKRGMTERAKRGECCSIAPFGYELKEKKLIIKTEQADIIREVFTRYVSGWGHKQIAVWLNELGVRTNRGGKIENRTVEYWLNNPVYHGYIRWTPTGKIDRNYHNPESIIEKGSHEPIIDESLWQMAQKRLAEQKHKYMRNRRENPTTEYALTGIVKCSYCGASLARSQKKYLQCINYAKGVCPISHHISMEEMLLLLYSAIQADLTSGNFTLERANVPNVNSDRAAVKNQIARAELKLKRVKEAYENGIDTLEEYKANKERINAEIERLHSKTGGNEKEMALDDKKFFAEKHLNILERLMSSETSDAEKNRLIKQFIKRLTYYKAEHKVIAIYLY